MDRIEHQPSGLSTADCMTRDDGNASAWNSLPRTPYAMSAVKWGSSDHLNTLTTTYHTEAMRNCFGTEATGGQSVSTTTTRSQAASGGERRKSMARNEIRRGAKNPYGFWSDYRFGPSHVFSQ